MAHFVDLNQIAKFSVSFSVTFNHYNKDHYSARYIFKKNMATEILPSRETLPVLSVYTTLNNNALYKGRGDFGDALTRASRYFLTLQIL